MEKEKNENVDIKDSQNEETTIENEDEVEALVVEETEVSEEDNESNVEGDEDSDCEPRLKIRMLENKIKEQEDTYLRLNAEYTNYRRRTAEEKSSIGIFANEKLMNELIPVIDNMERALESFENKEDSLYMGVDMVYKQMLDSLTKSGLEVIDSNEGVDFDPNFHMAVLQEASAEHEAGKVILTLQKGYKLGKKVLRPSMVKVSC